MPLEQDRRFAQQPIATTGLRHQRPDFGFDRIDPIAAILDMLDEVERTSPKRGGRLEQWQRGGQADRIRFHIQDGD
jgi:hypothetical protein